MKELLPVEEKVDSFTDLMKILLVLEKKWKWKVMEEKTDNEIIASVVSTFHQERFSNNKKVEFLAEQLSLIFTSPNGKRYSPSLLAVSVLGVTYFYGQERCIVDTSMGT